MAEEKKNELISLLYELNQTLLLAKINTNNPTDKQCGQLLEQLKGLSGFYSGGIHAYLNKAEILVTNFKKSHNEVPDYIGLPKNMQTFTLSREYEELEELARPYLTDVAIILVAGGLGERLGSKQIKVSIECEIITGITFMELYLEYMRAFSQLTGKKMHMFIMTSEDTHSQTVKFLQNFDYQSYLDLHIEMQDKVPAIKDLGLNLDVSDEFVLQTKPHGHGDVHFLVKESRILEKWTKDGVRYTYFIQDTNPFSLACLPVVLGSSLQQNHLLNFVGVLRRSEEPVGALVTDASGYTYNVEYNVFMHYMKSKELVEPKDSKGFGLYPGNINCFLLEIEEYRNILSKISSMKEFINIKFDKMDPNKIASSWRVECLMQDIAFSVSDPNRINVSIFDRRLAFTTCKNNLVTGKLAALKGISSETIAECENDIYVRNTFVLQHAGVNFTSNYFMRSLENLQESPRVLEEIKLVACPRVFVHPSFAVLMKDIRGNLSNVTFEPESDIVLVLKGKIVLKNCRFGNVSMWIENKPGQETLSLENFKVNGSLEDVLKFVSKKVGEKKEGDLRGYKVEDRSKIVKIGH